MGPETPPFSASDLKFVALAQASDDEMADDSVYTVRIGGHEPLGHLVVDAAFLASINGDEVPEAVVAKHLNAAAEDRRGGRHRLVEELLSPAGWRLHL